MHFHRWVTLGYKTRGPFLATVTIRQEKCAKCGRIRFKKIGGIKPKKGRKLCRHRMTTAHAVSTSTQR
jgi:hypothetical protein